jgi:hypothetical protein
LLTRSKLPRVVRPRLACREWLRDGKHMRLPCALFELRFLQPYTKFGRTILMI